MAILEPRVRSLDGSDGLYSTVSRCHDTPRCRISTDIDGEKITDVLQTRRAIQSTEYSHSIQVHKHEGAELCVQRSTFKVERSMSVLPTQDPKLCENGSKAAPGAHRLVEQLNPPREQNTFKAQINLSPWGDHLEAIAEHGDQTWNKENRRVAPCERWTATVNGFPRYSESATSIKASKRNRKR